MIDGTLDWWLMVFSFFLRQKLSYTIKNTVCLSVQNANYHSIEWIELGDKNWRSMKIHQVWITILDNHFRKNGRCDITVQIHWQSTGYSYRSSGMTRARGSETEREREKRHNQPNNEVSFNYFLFASLNSVFLLTNDIR